MLFGQCPNGGGDKLKGASLRGEEKNGTEEWERLRGLGGEGKHGTKKKVIQA